MLKSKFIQNEVEQQSSHVRIKNKESCNRPQAKNLIDYAIFCIKTNNVSALFKGYMSLLQIQVILYSRYFLRCHCCRKKRPDKIQQIIENNLNEKRYKKRYQGNMSSVPPIWW